MNILVIGSGGREHAMAKKLLDSPSSKSVYIMPGNAGIAMEGLIKVIDLAPGFEAVEKQVVEKKIDLVVVGPEDPLSKGMVDYLDSKGILALGPSRDAARLESSKIFSKKFMELFAIPTAAFRSYYNYQDSMRGLDQWDISSGIVIKVDGLAAGKGVVVTTDRKEAEETLYNFFKNPSFPVNAKSVLIEKMVKGKEVSVFALCDGNNYKLLGHATDYKRLNDGNHGPNTGGMGCYHDPLWPGKDLLNKVEEKVLRPTLDGMKKMGCPFKGILFLGLMVDGEEINTLEYNVRFGDPETQTLMPLIEGDLAKAFYKAAQGDLDQSVDLTLKNNFGIHIVMASDGYPGLDGKGMNLNNTIVIPDDLQKTAVYFAGVKSKDGFLVNSGGRVLGVSAQSANLEDALKQGYSIVESINFDGAYYRRDIGK